MASHAAETTSTESSSACPTHPPAVAAPPLFQNGVLTFQAHHVGWIVASFFSIVATAVSIWLILKHLTWYTNKRQQRQIVRLLLMVPIYSIISTLAYFFWNHAVPLSLIRDAYEGIILASFFYLLLQYLAPTQAEQKEYFRTYTLKKWAWPLGWVKRKPDGLYFLQLMKWAILQYCWVRPLSDLAAIALDMMDLYCEASWSPRFGSVWVLIIVSISVTIAMYCLIQFYLAISDRISQYRPILQLFSIKAIIFLMFWQSAFLSALHSFDVIKDTKYMSAEDINVGFAALLQTFEMVLFAFLHVKCFSYIPYRQTDRSEMTKKWPALVHALDFRDFWRETRDGSVYMWKTARGKEAEVEVRRRTHFERAMGKSRTLVDPKKELPPEPHADDDREYESEYDFGLPPGKSVLGDYGRSRTADLEKNARMPILRPAGNRREDVEKRHEGRQSSWWARLRRSLSNHDVEDDPSDPATPIRLPLHSSKDHVRTYAKGPVDLSDMPPPSLLKHAHGKSKSKTATHPTIDAQEDSLAEKQPLMIWDPSLTQPPHVPTLDSASVDKAPSPSLAHSGSDSRNVHSKEDSLLGRIFARSPDTDHSDKDRHTNDSHHAIKLPSIFNRKQEVTSAVKGWIHSPPKHSVSLLPPPKDSTSPAPEDIPSIPSLSPSPQRAIAVGPKEAKSTSPVALPTPAQPKPVPHKSLSQARRPSVLIADEAGLLSSVEPSGSGSGFRKGITLGVAGNGRGMPLPSSGTYPSDYQPMRIEPGGESSRWKESLSMRGPRRPKQIVLPLPLSPARYPGAEGPINPMIAPTMPAPSFGYNPYDSSNHRLPPGAGQPMTSPQFVDPPDLSHLRGYPPPGSRRSRHMGDNHVINPLASSPPGLQNSRSRPPEQTDRHSRQKDVSHSKRHGGRSSKSRADPTSPSSLRGRSHSPFRILSPISDASSLPLHPALRQHTARRRRQSQPLPPVPGAEPMLTDPRIDTQDIPPSNIDLGNSPGSPGSPSSIHADSRYPRATSRSTYFDEYDTVNPYLTTIMTGAVPPEPISEQASSPESTRRLKRR